MTHELKSHPEAFQARWAGLKTWEYRFNDRNFKAHDHLHEREYTPGSNGVEGTYSGCHILSRVMFVMEGGKFGIPEGACIMTVETIAKGQWLPRVETNR